MNKAHGRIDQTALGRKDDFLYRISLKAYVANENGEVLVVKEAGRSYWDLPGGGMDHGESIKSAIARELAEEVNLAGDFTYSILDADEPGFLKNANVWQVRLVFKVDVENLRFSTGEDSDEIAFVNPKLFKDSSFAVEQRIYDYSLIANK